MKTIIALDGNYVMKQPISEVEEFLNTLDFVYWHPRADIEIVFVSDAIDEIEKVSEIISGAEIEAPVVFLRDFSTVMIATEGASPVFLTNKDLGGRFTFDLSEEGIAKLWKEIE